MSLYVYTFKSSDGTLTTSNGCNLFQGAKRVGITIVRADFLPKWYLSSVKFEDRVRTIWGIMEGSSYPCSFIVSQGYSRL